MLFSGGGPVVLHNLYSARRLLEHYHALLDGDGAQVEVRLALWRQTGAGQPAAAAAVGDGSQETDKGRRQFV